MPSYFLAISSRCQRSSVSGVTIQARSLRAFRPTTSAFFSEPLSLGLGETQPFVANLFTEYAVFLFEVIDYILLCTIDPTRPHRSRNFNGKFMKVIVSHFSRPIRRNGHQKREPQYLNTMRYRSAEFWHTTALKPAPGRCSLVVLLISRVKMAQGLSLPIVRPPLPQPSDV